MSDISLGTNGKLGNDTADHVGVPVSEDASIGLITDWMKTWSYIEGNVLNDKKIDWVIMSPPLYTELGT